jgi:hypothetical protein
VAHDAGVPQQAVDVVLAEGGHRLDLEAREGCAEVVALAQDRQPGQARLEALQHQALVQAAVVCDRPPPLLVVVGGVLRARRAPGAAAAAVLETGHERRGYRDRTRSVRGTLAP